MDLWKNPSRILDRGDGGTSDLSPLNPAAMTTASFETHWRGSPPFHCRRGETRKTSEGQSSLISLYSMA